jgi:hypothetical protein
MKIIFRLFLFVSLLSITACDSMLEPELDGSLNENGIWQNNVRAFAFLNNAYNNLPSGYNRISSAMLDAATDDAVCPEPTSSIQDFNNGGWGPYNVIDNVWDKNYQGIRKVNTFFEKIDSVPVPRTSNALGADETILITRERMKGEAFFLRAFFYFELVKRYGGVPLTDKVLTPDEAIVIPRASIKDCFQFILNDCDSAAARLPRKYGATPVVVGYNDAKELGRATSGAALALKSRVLLYWASPLFNTEQNDSLWIKASEAAKKVLDYTLNADGTGGVLYGLNRYTSTISLSDLFTTSSVIEQYHKEIIFSTKYSDNSTIEQLNAPISFGAKGLTNPTQNLVDAFPMKNGKSIDDPTSGYDPQNPFANRDPRLEMTVLGNGISFSVNDKTGVLETFDGGKDGAGSFRNASKTGYYLRKFLLTYPVWDGRTVTASRTWILIRLAEVYLNYAEARNEAFGPDAEVYAALKELRKRAGFRPTDIKAGLNKEQMRKVIQNERRIELAFEEHRFFDVRRWRLFDDPAELAASMNIKAASIKKNTDGTIQYNEAQTIRTYQFSEKMYLYPIAASELMKNKALIQNPEW